MNQLSALLCEARNIADEKPQDKQDIVQVRNIRKSTRIYTETNSETIRPVIITIIARPTQFHFAHSMQNSFAQLKIFCIRELPNNKDFFIQPEYQNSREFLMNASNLQLVFPNTSIKARNTLPKAKTKPSILIINDHHIMQKKRRKNFSTRMQWTLSRCLG